MSKTIDVASESSSDPALQSLRKDLKKLRLDDIAVDVTSVELAMHEEMAILRGAIKNGAASVTTGLDDVGGGDSSARVKALESENGNLRGLLKELKAELNSGKRSSSRSASPVLVDSGDNTELQKELQAKDEVIAAQKAEIETLKTGASSAATAANDASAKKIKELEVANAELQGRLDEITKKAEKEQNEMMEVMAQEIEVCFILHLDCSAVLCAPARALCR